MKTQLTFANKANRDARYRENVPRVNRRLPAFKITLEDGSSYITSMSKDTTLEDARDYFLGQRLTQQDETTTLLVTSVDNPPRQCGGQVT